MPIEKRRVFRAVPVKHDKEIHVCVTGTVGGDRFVDIREYIPSLEAYGRGLMFPPELFPEVMGGLDEAYADLGYDKALDMDLSMRWETGEDDTEEDDEEDDEDEEEEEEEDEEEEGR